MTDYKISEEAFVMWAKKEYAKDPTKKVTIKFVLDCLNPGWVPKPNKPKDEGE